MTVPQFSRPGAVDLSSLQRPGASPGPAGQPGQPGGGSGRFTIDVVGEEGLRKEVLERSLSVPVLASFWSPDVAASVQINETLSRLADEFGGRFVFARVDVSSQPELAQALGIPEVPLVVAVMRGQLAPLLQDPIPEAELRAVVQQVLQAAAANGVAGVSPPLSAGESAEPVAEDEAEPEPAHPTAEEALLAGDVDKAIAEYEAALAAAPADEEASLGLARARLLKRTQGVDLAAARAAAAADPDDIDAQLLIADLDLLGGNVDDAFARLIELVRRTSGDDRDRVRTHLIELFGVVGDDDPRVGKARSMLASALF
jgi:putative thioredoxin